MFVFLFMLVWSCSRSTDTHSSFHFFLFSPLNGQVLLGQQHSPIKMLYVRHLNKIQLSLDTLHIAFWTLFLFLLVEVYRHSRCDVAPTQSFRNFAICRFSNGNKAFSEIALSYQWQATNSEKVLLIFSFYRPYNLSTSICNE